MFNMRKRHHLTPFSARHFACCDCAYNKSWVKCKSLATRECLWAGDYLYLARVLFSASFIIVAIMNNLFHVINNKILLSRTRTHSITPPYFRTSSSLMAKNSFKISILPEILLVCSILRTYNKEMSVEGHGCLLIRIEHTINLLLLSLMTHTNSSIIHFNSEFLWQWLSLNSKKIYPESLQIKYKVKRLRTKKLSCLEFW